METAKWKVLDWISLYNEWEYEKAIKLFQDVLKEKNIDELAMFYLWNTFWALWKFNKAIEVFDEILNFDSGNEKVLKAKEIFENLEKNSWDSLVVSQPRKQDAWEFNFPSVELVGAQEELKKQISVRNPSVQKKKKGSDKYIHSLEIYEKATNETNIYDFLKSSEAEKFLATSEAKNIKNIIDNIWTNPFDKAEILNHIRAGNNENLIRFIKSIRLRNSILDYLADFNVIPPKKYITISTQIVNINADFWLAFLMFNLWEHKYNEIIMKLWKSPINDLEIKKDITWEPVKIWILKVLSNFFMGIFSFEKAFENENNKLKYFQYLFIFLWFVWVLILLGYWFKMWAFNVDIRWEVNSNWKSTNKVYRINSNF